MWIAGVGRHSVRAPPHAAERDTPKKPQTVNRGEHMSTWYRRRGRKPRSRPTRSKTVRGQMQIAVELKARGVKVADIARQMRLSPRHVYRLLRAADEPGDDREGPPDLPNWPAPPGKE